MSQGNLQFIIRDHCQILSARIPARQLDRVSAGDDLAAQRAQVYNLPYT